MDFTCGNIADFLEEKAPSKFAEHWDNVGLLVGSRSNKIKRIMLCLDITTKVMEEAIKKDIDMLISHHPLLFKPLNRLNFDDWQGKIIYNLIKNDICVYSAHTNLDVAVDGVNDALAKALGIVNASNLKEYKSEGFFNESVSSSGEKTYGLGKAGCLEKPMPLEKFIEFVKNQLNINAVRIIGDKKGAIGKVAVFSGSFDGDLDPVISHEIDVLVTGDVKYHTAVEIVEKGCCVIDAGHFNTEIVVLPSMAKILSERFREIEVLCSNVEEEPFRTC